MRSRIGAAITAALLALCAGCANSPRPISPNPFQIEIQSSKSLNADSNGRPSPLRIIIYELKSVANFESVDFFSLSQKDQATLGADLIEKEEFFINPGESRIVLRKGHPDAAFVGVFAEFRDLDKAVWRANALLPPKGRDGMLAAGLSMLKPEPLTKTYRILLDQKSVKMQF